MALAQEAYSKALNGVEEGKNLGRLLWETLISLKDLAEKEETSQLKGKCVAFADLYFEKVKEHVDLFYPNLELNRMDMFKVFRDNQVVDDG